MFAAPAVREQKRDWVGNSGRNRRGRRRRRRREREMKVEDERWMDESNEKGR